MPAIERDGCPIFWEEHGRRDAPPILMIMGMAFSSRAWVTLPARLARDYRVITFDNRWTGRSKPASLGLSVFRSRVFRIADLADDAAAVLAAAAIDSAHVFGISMGGMIAQELVLRHPQRVKSLALGATFADYASGHQPQFQTLIDVLIASTMKGEQQRTRLGKHLVSETYIREHEPDFGRWLANAEYGGRRLALAQMAAVMGHSTLHRLDAVKAPTLVLTGDADRLVPPANSTRIAELIPASKLSLIQGAGHVFPLEREAETYDLLAAHFGPT